MRLVVSASVQGLPAYRDLTPIYDTVWWETGSVIYLSRDDASISNSP